MLFTNYSDLVAKAVSYYDDTDIIDSGWTLPTPHAKRIYHYVNRAQEEIWYYRPWPWRMATMDADAISVSNGVAQMPTNFSNVGPNGLFLDQEGRPWAEIGVQDMVVLRKRQERTRDHLFCVGEDATQYDDGDIGDDAGVRKSGRYIMVPNTGETMSGFQVYFEMIAPHVSIDNANDAIGVPPNYHHALLMGTVAKMQEAKGDARSIWRSDFVATLAKMAAENEHLTSRPRQMPVTIGRMW